MSDSGQVRCVRIEFNARIPMVGPPPTDSGSSRLDLIPIYLADSLSRTASGGRSSSARKGNHPPEDHLLSAPGIEFLDTPLDGRRTP